LEIIHSITGNSIPVLSWITISAASTLRLYGPENLGGFGNVAANSIEESQRTGKKVEDIADEASLPSQKMQNSSVMLSPPADVSPFQRQISSVTWDSSDV